LGNVFFREFSRVFLDRPVAVVVKLTHFTPSPYAAQIPFRRAFEN
jgi:hypothetical protein